jgi:sulfate adenylyltransferase
MSTPHGGTLVNRTLPRERVNATRREAQEMPKLRITAETIIEIQNLAEGVFSPLDGFLTQDAYTAVLHEKRLPDGTPWTIPIVLDVAPHDRAGIRDGDDVALIDHDGDVVAVLHVADIYPFDKDALTHHVFGTTDRDHPGVHRAYAMHPYLIGGAIDLVQQPRSLFPECYYPPRRAHRLFQERGWRTIVGFQTRNVPHLGHEYIQRTALNFADGLFVQPIVGSKQVGDFKDEVILAAYRTLIDRALLPKNTVLGTLQTSMRYAGPREAVFHAIIRKNFGCTHFIVGRDHAGVRGYYPPYSAHAIFNEFPDLGITPLCFTSVFYCQRCEGMANERICPHRVDHRHEFSGTKLRDCLVNGQVTIPGLRPEVCQVIRRWKQPFIKA